MLIILFICTFSFSPIIFCYRFLSFSAHMRVGVFKTCIHLLRVEVHCVQENHDAGIYFTFFFSVFPFSISHSIVIHREFCVNDSQELLISYHIIIGFLINVQVQGQHPHQWAPFQIAGLLHAWQISHQVSRYVCHES